METSPPPHPAIDLSKQLYYQLVYTLNGLLPPPLDGSPGASHARNQAAIAKAASMLPVNANEADLAAQCIAARAQAEDILRLLRQKGNDDIALVIRLNAQYSSMVRTSLSVHARLMRVQAVRQKRDATEATANQDAWTQHIAEKSMLKVADLDYARLNPASQSAPAEASVAPADQKTDESASKIEQILTARPLRRNRDNTPEPKPGQSLEAHLYEIGRAGMAQMGFLAPEVPANGRESLGRAG